MIKNNEFFLFSAQLVLSLQHQNTTGCMITEEITKVTADNFVVQSVVRAWIFGSFARREETPESDVDMLVEYDKTTYISLLSHT